MSQLVKWRINMSNDAKKNHQGGWPFNFDLTPDEKICLQRVLNEISANNIDGFLMDRTELVDNLLGIGNPGEFKPTDLCKDLEHVRKNIVKHRLQWDNTLMRARITMKNFKSQSKGDGGIYLHPKESDKPIMITIRGSTDNPPNGGVFSATHPDGKPWNNILELVYLDKSNQAITEEKITTIEIDPNEAKITKFDIATTTKATTTKPPQNYTTNAVFVSSHLIGGETNNTKVYPINKMNEAIEDIEEAVKEVEKEEIEEGLKEIKNAVKEIEEEMEYLIVIGSQDLIIDVQHPDDKGNEVITSYPFLISGYINTDLGDMILLLDQANITDDLE